MGEIWFTSDTHFWHANILRFTNAGGTRIRHEFPEDAVEAMNEKMIEEWRKVVAPHDKIYHLGDVSFKYGQELSSVMSRLPGHKRLILGNHDKLKGTNLADWFQKVELWRCFGKEGFFCTHIPTHRDNFPHSCKVNVHGHIHAGYVKCDDYYFGNPLENPAYMNVCVEVTAYRPIHMDEILEHVKRCG